MTPIESLGINVKHLPKVYDRVKNDIRIYEAAVMRFDEIKATVMDSTWVMVVTCAFDCQALRSMPNGHFFVLSLDLLRKRTCWRRLLAISHRIATTR